MNSSMNPTIHPGLAAGPIAAAGPLSLGQRGRDLLGAVRREQRAEAPVACDEPPAERIARHRSLAVAYLVLAEESIDGELAAISLARQLACPAGSLDAAAVALLMLDPLGATLRLAGRPGDRPVARPATRIAPQYRVANRSDWPDLLGRVPPSVRLMLVLDQTGQQHNLLSRGGEPPTVIVVTRAGADGRVSAYRRLKELTQSGAGDVGFFFVDSMPAEPADPDAPDANLPLAARAEGTFARLASTAEQFLRRRVAFFGSMAGTNASGVSIEMLGQRPSLNGQENRQELTRWLGEHSHPLAELEDVDGPPEGMHHEELAELADPMSAAPDAPPGPPLAAAVDEPESAAADPFVPRSGASDVLATLRGVPSTTLPADDGLSVVPLPAGAQPADDAAWAAFLADRPGMVQADSLLDFRPPNDPTTLLLHAGGRLMLVRFAIGDLIAGSADLLASLLWARQHWPLIRKAFPLAGLPDEPRTAAVLIGRSIPHRTVELFAMRFAELRLANLLTLDLSQAGGGRGVVVQMMS